MQMTKNGISKENVDAKLWKWFCKVGQMIGSNSNTILCAQVGQSGADAFANLIE